MENLKQHGLLAGILGASLLLAGCEGNVLGGGQSGAPPVGGPGGPGGPGTSGGPGGAGSPGVTTSDCGAASVGAQRIHRLTPGEYTNTVRTLLASDAFAPELDADREPIATLDGVRKWYN